LIIVQILFKKIPLLRFTFIIYKFYNTTLVQAITRGLVHIYNNAALFGCFLLR